MKKNVVSVMLMYLSLYVLQFLVIPSMYDNVIGRGNEGIFVLSVTTVIATIGILFYCNKLLVWLIGFGLYTGLIVLYSPPGAYGIGIVGLDLDGMRSYYDSSEKILGIVIVLLLVALVQFIVWCGAKLASIVIKKRVVS